MLLYGPYINLKPGAYEIAIIIDKTTDVANSSFQSTLKLEFVCDLAQKSLFEESINGNDFGTSQLILRTFEISSPCRAFEIRAIVEGPDLWTVSLPTLKSRPESAA